MTALTTGSSLLRWATIPPPHWNVLSPLLTPWAGRAASHPVQSLLFVLRLCRGNHEVDSREIGLFDERVADEIGFKAFRFPEIYNGLKASW